ncbi:MAG: proline dehydrogenase family protein [Microscillaceae bacterium]|nr:proline dehydrogenase family protein [Microscillaceae bacterium]MDW8460960.1 proline dehydrogenase family protein [Cytophagales bacterium]
MQTTETLPTTSTSLSFEDTSIAFSAKSDWELKKTYWLFSIMNQNWLVKVGTSLIKTAFSLRLPITWVVKQTIFEQFCGGESIEDCQKTIDKLHQYGIGTILDYSVEGEKNEASFEATTQEILRTIEKAAQQPNSIPFCVFKVTGIAPFNLLEKIQAQQPLNPDEETAWQKVKQRVNTLCQTAYQKNVRIFMDAEESWIQKTIDSLAYDMMRLYNKEKAIVYNTYQFYCHATLQNYKQAIEMAQKEGFWLGAKLVRGAYMEKERKRAKEKGYSDPIQPNKISTDTDFDEALHWSISHLDHVAICAGTHNEYSSKLLTQLMQKKGISPNDKRVFFAQLLGMSDHISYNLAKAGYNVAKYVPYGPVKAVMPYLFRRAEENTSVAGQASREYLLVKAEVKRRKMQVK